MVTSCSWTWKYLRRFTAAASAMMPLAAARTWCHGSAYLWRPPWKSWGCYRNWHDQKSFLHNYLSGNRPQIVSLCDSWPDRQQYQRKKKRTTNGARALSETIWCMHWAFDHAAALPARRRRRHICGCTLPRGKRVTGRETWFAAWCWQERSRGWCFFCVTDGFVNALS